MNCYFHPTKPAVAQCVDCHKGLCSTCAHKYDIPICDDCNRKRKINNVAHYITPFIICIVLFAIGHNVEIFGPDQVFGAYMLMCAYGGWKAINQFFPMIFVWFNMRSVFWFFLIKLAISMFIGFFITPVYLIYCLYKIIRVFV
ncbi:MAG: hypothetical protein ACI3ZQ_03600 [Candidatus Cryptobacteroides sp.]